MSHGDRSDPSNLIRIGPFSRMSSLSPRQLRTYDRAGLLPAAQVDALSGHRYYERAQAATAELIALLRSVDVPLSVIQKLLRADHGERRRVLAEHRSILVDRLAQAQRMLTTLDSMLEEATMTEATTTEATMRCSFCEKTKPVDRLVPDGSPVRICPECLDLCVGVLAADSARESDGPATRCVGRMTKRAKDALAGGLKLAEEMGHPHVGTEHLLIALGAGNGLAARILTESGLDQDALRAKVEIALRDAEGTRTEQACSLCGREAADVSKLIAGPAHYICDDCVRVQRQAIGAS